MNRHALTSLTVLLCALFAAPAFCTDSDQPLQPQPTNTTNPSVARPSFFLSTPFHQIATPQRHGPFPQYRLGGFNGMPGYRSFVDLGSGFSFILIQSRYINAKADTRTYLPPMP